MLLQAIPVLHFFSSHKAIFYTYVDEEKPEQKSKVEKEDGKEYLTLTIKTFAEAESTRLFFHFLEKQPSSPLLEFLTPPPDAC